MAHICAGMLLTFLCALTSAATFTVDPSKTYQTMDGIGFFGGSSVNWEPPIWNEQWADAMINDLGMTITRQEFYPGDGPFDADNGMVMDFGDLKAVKMFTDLFDHATVFWSCEDPEMTEFFFNHCKRVLVMKKNTTAENMARLLREYTVEYLKNKGCTNLKVIAGVYETRTGYAEASESDKDDVLVSMSDEVAEDFKKVMKKYWNKEKLK